MSAKLCWTKIIALTMAFPVTTVADSQCEASFTSVPALILQSPVIAVAAGAQSIRSGSADIRVTTSGPGCRLFLGIAGRPGNRLVHFGGASLGYELWGSSDLSQPIGDHATRPLGTLLASSRTGPTGAYFTIFYSANTDSGVAPGSYSDSPVITLYEDSFGALRRLDESLLRIHAHVAASISLTLGLGGQANLDFGSLEANASRSLDFMVIANVPYDIVLESENNGALVAKSNHISGRIPYLLEFDGVLASLDGTGQFALGATPVKSLHTLRIAIGPFGDVVSGTYDDHLTVTIRTR